MAVGIKELKELVKFGLKLGEALGKALEDGKINLVDALKFLPVLKDLKIALEGASEIPAELKDLDEAELQELKVFIKDEFNLPDDALEAKIEMGLEVAVSLISLALGFKK